MDWYPRLKADGGGFGGLKWIAAVVLNASVHMLRCLRDTMCLSLCVRPRLRHFRASAPHTNNNDRQTDSSEGSQMDAGQLLEPKPAEIVRTGPESVWLVVTDRIRGLSCVHRLCLLCPPLPRSPLAAAPKTQDSSWECLCGSDSNMGEKGVRRTLTHIYTHAYPCRSLNIPHVNLFWVAVNPQVISGRKGAHSDVLFLLSGSYSYYCCSVLTKVDTYAVSYNR